MLTQRAGLLPLWRSGCRQTSAQPPLPRSSSLLNKIKSVFGTFIKSGSCQLNTRMYFLNHLHLNWQQCFSQCRRGSYFINSRRTSARTAILLFGRSWGGGELHFRSNSGNYRWYFLRWLQMVLFCLLCFFSLVETVPQLLPLSKSQLRICMWSLANLQHLQPSLQDDPSQIFSGTR